MYERWSLLQHNITSYNEIESLPGVNFINIIFAFLETSILVRMRDEESVLAVSENKRLCCFETLDRIIK